MHRRETSNTMYPQRRRTPSFSSSLLDTIYHSIDESNSNQTTIIKKERTKMNLRQAVMIEDWMEKQTSSTTSTSTSTSSSSECSSARLFFSSSSETEYSTSTTTLNKKQTSKPKQKQQKQKQKQKNKAHEEEREGGFARALKVYYGELNQKVRQPVSPGRISRIATFLSSIFSSENVKKAKMCYVGAVQDVTFQSKSPPCSFSTRKSCMSKKTPSSSSSSARNIKRSVRFYPVSVILGEDSNSNQQSVLPKITRNHSSIQELKKNNVMVKENGVCNGKGEFGFRGFYDDVDEDEDVDEDDDALSYSSSDLFELDHLIGAERFQEELPVYETTNLETNKAIANGLRL